MKKLLAVVLASVMALSSPMAVSAEETINVSGGTDVEAYAETFDEQSEAQVEATDSGIVDEYEIVTALEGKEELFEKYQVAFKLSAADLSAKRQLYNVIDSLENAIPGRDYISNQIVVKANDKARAEEIAKGFDGKLLSFQDGIAVVETEISTLMAVSLASDSDMKLPAVYPNFYYTTESTEGKKAYTAIDSVEGVDPDAFEESMPDMQSSIDAIMGQLDIEVVSAGQEEVIEIPDDNLEESVTGAGVASVNDPEVSKQWYHQVIDTFNAWKVTKGKGVTVAVIDSGIDASHAEFAGRVTAVNKVTLPFLENGAADNEGHGTHVAGIIGAAADNGQGGVGVAPEVNILSVKALEKYGNGASGTTADIVAAVNYAVAQNVRVINMSLGGPSDVTDLLYQDAVDTAVDKGIAVIAAAGNDSIDISKGLNKTVPACLDGVITVASLDKLGALSYFSNYGKIDVAAPGGTAVADNDPTDIYSTVPGGYAYMAGTSMAAPVVSGVVALMAASGSYERSANGARAIASDLKSSCINMGNKKNFGAGRVNAAAAVEAISIYTKEGSFSVVTGKSLKLLVKAAGKSVKPVWSVSDESVGTITKAGAFKAAKGITAVTTVNVTATCGTVSDTAVITVYPAAGVITSNTDKRVTLEYGQTMRFSVASDFPCTYKTSNNKVALVTENGVICALSNGSATVTATTVGGKKVTVKVKVTGTPYKIDHIVAASARDRKGMQMFAESPWGSQYITYPLTAGKSMKFQIQSSWPYSTSSNKKVIWAADNVAVNQSGVVKMSRSIEQPTLGTVVAVPVEGVGKAVGIRVAGFKAIGGFHFGSETIVYKVNKTTNVSVSAGGSTYVDYSVIYKNRSDIPAMNPYPYVQSSDSSIATGYCDTSTSKLRIEVTGKKAGKCKLTLISMDGSYQKATINVTVR